MGWQSHRSKKRCHDKPEPLSTCELQSTLLRLKLERTIQFSRMKASTRAPQQSQSAWAAGPASGPGVATAQGRKPQDAGKSSTFKPLGLAIAGAKFNTTNMY